MNESGEDTGLFNICHQNPAGYPNTSCTCSTCHEKDLAGRGLIQLSYSSNYLPVSYILTAMNKTLSGSGKLNTNYQNILNNLPTDPIYPPICGQGINNWCKSASNLTKNCCVAPLLPNAAAVGEGSVDCAHINKTNTIYTNPSLVCTPPLSILTSLIYESANSVYAITNFKYQFQFSACLINQGGMPYPICTNYYNKLTPKNGGYPENIVLPITNCNIENVVARYDGFCTIMNLLFPKNNINSKNDWYITLQDGLIYSGCSNKHNAGLFSSCDKIPNISLPNKCTQ